jgi:hypothetical protein
VLFGPDVEIESASFPRVTDPASVYHLVTDAKDCLDSRWTPQPVGICQLLVSLPQSVVTQARYVSDKQPFQSIKDARFSGAVWAAEQNS